MDKEKEKILIEMYIAQDKPPKDIADILGISLPAYYCRCRKYGITWKRRKKRVFSNKDNAVLQMRREGATLAEIGDCLGITREAVRQRIKKYNKTAEQPLGKEYNRKKRVFKGVVARREAVAKMRLGGASYAEMAETFNISFAMVVADMRQVLLNNPSIPRSKHSRIDSKAQEDIIQRYLDGEPLKEISARYSIRVSSVNRILRRNGAPLRIAAKKSKKQP